MSNERRNQEARLLVGAGTVVAVAVVLLQLSVSPDVPSDSVLQLGLLAVGAAGAHLLVRRLAPDADPLLLPLAVLLNGLGLVLVRRVDLAESTTRAASQTTWTYVALAAFAITLLVVRRHSALTRIHYTVGLATIALLLLPLLPVIGTEVNGSRLWVRVGGLGFQPGEVAKLGLVVFLAGYLERTRSLLSVATNRLGPLLLPETRHLAPVLATTGLALGIVVFQKDLGSGLLFFGVAVIMLYVATGRVAYPAVGAVAFATGAVLAHQTFGHVRDRVSIWLDPWSVANDEGYQIVQATFGLASGGLTGTGLGLGRPDVPEAETDAIFAVLGEELGLLGATAVLVVFAILVVRGLTIAMHATDETGTLLALGLATVLGLQVFVIVGGITRVVPFTGITLPFVSYGGSSLVSNYVLVALLLRISDATGRRDRGGTRRRRALTRGTNAPVVVRA